MCSTGQDILPFQGRIIFYYIYLPHCLCLLIYPCTSGLLPLLAIVNNEHECANMFLDPFSILLSICPKVGLLDHTTPLFLVFWRISILFSIVVAPFYNPSNSAHRLHFSTSSLTLNSILFFFSLSLFLSLPSFLLSFSFSMVAILMGVKWHLVVLLGLHSSDDWWCWVSFCRLVGYFYSIIGEMSIHRYLFLCLQKREKILKHSMLGQLHFLLWQEHLMLFCRKVWLLVKIINLSISSLSFIGHSA